MSAWQAQNKRRLWEIGEGGRKKKSGNLCKTPVVSNSEVSPHLQVVSKIGERRTPSFPHPPTSQGIGDWEPSCFQLSVELSFFSREERKALLLFHLYLTLKRFSTTPSTIKSQFHLHTQTPYTTKDKHRHPTYRHTQHYICIYKSLPPHTHTIMHTNTHTTYKHL